MGFFARLFRRPPARPPQGILSIGATGCSIRVDGGSPQRGAQVGRDVGAVVHLDVVPDIDGAVVTAVAYRGWASTPYTGRSMDIPVDQPAATAGVIAVSIVATVPAAP